MKLLPSFKKKWKNCVGLQVAHPLALFKPSTLSEIIQIVKEAEASKYKVKAVGSGHSFSDIAITRDYHINTHGLNRELNLNTLSLKQPSGNADLFFCECGITIKRLNAALEKAGKALPNMGAYTGQTIAGAISTSTHGSGMGLGSLASLVETVILVGENGRVYHIEKTNGISASAVKLNNIHVEFIQDDDVFYSTVVSMGCLGIVYAFVLRVCDAYLLKEVRTFTTWEKIKNSLLNNELLINNRHIEILVNPYTIASATEHSCLVTERNICEPQTDTSWMRLNRSVGYTLIGWLIPDFVIDAVLRFLFNNCYKWTPALLEISLKTLRDGCYIDKSYKVLDLGSANNLSAYGMEIAFPSANYMAVVDELFTILTKIAKEGNQYLTCCFSLRFVKTSQHYLAMQYGDGDDFVCMIEFPILNGTIGGVEMLNRIEEIMYQYGGVPHWGQYNHVGVGDHTLKKLYPKFPAWLLNYQKFCPNGTFENSFTERCRIVSANV